MLMSQQGVLLGFDGVGAKVGFRSAPLQKAARDRIPNLEAAFQRIFKRPIKISLEVVTTPKATESTGVSSSSSAPAHLQPPGSLPNNQANGPAANRPSTDNGYPRNRNDEDSDENTRPLNSLNAFVPSHHDPGAQLFNSPPNSQPNPRLDAPGNGQLSDQDQEKVKRFASFFNGQIVNLDDDSDSSLPSSADQTGLMQKGSKSSEPSPDVPF